MHYAPPLTTERCEATVKDLERARAKVDQDYNGDARRVVDFVRASGIFETPTDLVSALAHLDETPDVEDHAPRLRVVRARACTCMRVRACLRVRAWGGSQVAERRLQLLHI